MEPTDSSLGEGSLKTAMIQPGMFKEGPFSLPIPNSPIIPGETIPRRRTACINGLISTPEEGVNTVYDVLVLAAERYGNLNAMGERKLIKTHYETKMVKKTVEGKEKLVEKKWTFFEMGGFEYLSFREYVALTMELGAGLRFLGLEKEDRVHIFAATSPYWLAISHAAITQSMPIITSYATLGQDGLEFSLYQTRAKAIFVDPDLLQNLMRPLKKATEIKFVIWNSRGHETVKQKDLDALKAEYPDLMIISYDELLKMGRDNRVEPVKPGKEDLCCIMYTSGTTGEPKGVPLSHKNIVASIAGLNSSFSFYVGPGDSVLAYLPLAHSFEFAFENVCIYWGVTMGYGSPRTLSDTSMKNCHGDIKTFRPTILVGVPAVWETIRSGIEEKLSAMPALARWMFTFALVLKEFLCEKGAVGAAGVLDTLVFNKVKSETGGRLRACFNGAGPLGEDTRKFVSYVVVPLISGYGLTETTAMGALQDPREWTADTLGSIPSSIEIKLLDFPDAGYFSTNSPPQGEILIRGDSVMSGYYLNDVETAAAITPDGWFKTGDIGEWAPNGHLKIIDRKKNLVKTLNGEYIALEKLESIYRASPLISNVCVFASPTRARPIGIIIPSIPALLRLGSSSTSTPPPPSISTLIHSPEMHSLVLKSTQETGLRAGLAHFEILENIVLTDCEWTSGNTYLTPSQKLNRRKIISQYSREIEDAYEHDGKNSKKRTSHL